MTYCQYARSLPADNLHRIHHDSEHGSPAVDDDDLFRRLMLEIMQAGLSFETVLKRKETIYAAFPGIDRAAAVEQRDIGPSRWKMRRLRVDSPCRPNLSRVMDAWSLWL